MSEGEDRPSPRPSSGPQAPGNPVPGPRGLGLLLLLAAVVAGLWLWGSLESQGQAGPRITYSALLRLLDGGSVSRVTLQGRSVHGVLQDTTLLRTEAGDTVRAVSFQTTVPAMEDPGFLPLLREKGTEVDVRPEQQSSWLWILLMSFGPFVLIFGIWIFFMRRMRTGGEGLLSVGRSGARLYDRTKEKTTFDDVAGSRGAKQELQEIIEFLKSPDRFRRMGAEIPKGVLLVGPPGTGKTLLARAVAGEADVPFFSITGSDFMEMFVGVGPKRVRDLFKSARDAAPSIIFIDEIDAIGGRRGAGIWVGGADERERTLNQLLSEMSGFEGPESVIVMAATNRPDILDPALLRPGRFDRRIAVDLPAQEDRLKILQLYARTMPLAPEVDLDAIARGTPGFSGADLKNLLNEAALLAARTERERITNQDIDQARDKILMGLEREGLALTDEEIRFLSFHEAGHAVLAAVLPHTDPLHKVTIVPRGRAMGVTQQLPERDRYVYGKDYMLDRITVLMGGRAAEELVLGTLTSGAEDDLHQAVSMARRMVLDWGMSDELGPLVGEPTRAPLSPEEEMIPQPREFSEERSRRADEAIEEIVDDCYGRAKKVLEEHRKELDRIAERLRAVEELSGAEVLALLGRTGGSDGSAPGPAAPSAGPGTDQTGAKGA